MQIVKKSFKNARLCLAAVLVAASAGSVQAGVVFTTGVQPDPATVSNVRFLPTLAGVDFGPDTTITGRAANTPYLVDFTANELLIAFDQPATATTPGIAPGLRATDGVLHGLDVNVRNSSFTTLFYNLHLDTITRNPAGRFADIIVTSFDGRTTSYTQQLLNGNNLLLIRADNSTLLRSVSIASSSNITELIQFRVGGLGLAPVSVPEPGMLWSFSLAGLALWGVRSRRRNGGCATRSDYSQA
jgi:hypothetical protein